MWLGHSSMTGLVLIRPEFNSSYKGKTAVCPFILWGLFISKCIFQKKAYMKRFNINQGSASHIENRSDTFLSSQHLGS